jgi:hypothetical protein
MANTYFHQDTIDYLSARIKALVNENKKLKKSLKKSKNNSPLITDKNGNNS